MSVLALLGGPPVREKPFPVYNSVGAEEKCAAREVMDSGILSDFLGEYGDKFEGGKHVRGLEEEWARAFGVRHAVSVNSATSGLFIAVEALGLQPGDEILVSPYSMSASASCAALRGGVPVFVDVEPDCFCMDPADMARKITPRTRAIVVVDLTGQPAALDKVMALAARHHLLVIEDCAQAPGARFHDRWAGTVAHMGVYSLNCHKVIQTGEGGVVVTNDDHLALRLKLLRNHAEAVVGKMPSPSDDLVDLFGGNYRLTELQAAIARAQLKKMQALNRERQDRVAYLNERLQSVPGLTMPVVRPNCTHVYYRHLLRFDDKKAGIPRALFLKALDKEGVHASAGYVRPLYQLPYFRKKCPATPPCPVVENLHEKEIVVNALITPPLSERDLDDVVAAYVKVIENAKALREMAG